MRPLLSVLPPGRSQNSPTGAVAEIERLHHVSEPPPPKPAGGEGRRITNGRLNPTRLLAFAKRNVLRIGGETTYESVTSRDRRGEVV